MWGLLYAGECLPEVQVSFNCHSKVFHMSFKSLSLVMQKVLRRRFKRSFKMPLKSSSAVLQRFFKGPSTLLQRSFKGASKSFKSHSELIQTSFKSHSKVIQKSFKCPSKVIQNR